MSFGKCIFLFNAMIFIILGPSVLWAQDCFSHQGGRACYQGAGEYSWINKDGKRFWADSLGALSVGSVKPINASEGEAQTENSSFQSDEAPQVVPAAADENDADFSVPDNSPIDI